MNLKQIVSKCWPLVLILLLGGTLRLYGLLLNPISLFSDEVDMGYQAYSLLKTGCDYSGHCLPVQFHSFSDVQPPIPIYLIALANLIGFPLDLAIRLIPAVFGTLGILMTYLFLEILASKKLFDLHLRGVGLMSSLVLAIIPWHVTYSRIGFSLALLYFFVVTGFYLFSRYLITSKDKYLYLACLTLGLTPMVYNTAKMAIFFYPLVLLVLPGAFDLFRRKLQVKVSFLALYIPLIIMFAAGRTTARFDYISIHTDPTAPTEVNYQRLIDSGPMAKVGTSPSIASKLLHNRPLFFAKNLMNNVYGLFSTDFLFIKGDPNLRHSPANSGMFYRTVLPLLFIGLYFLIRYRHEKLILLLILLTLIPVSTSAITRDGSSHASRSFMMTLPFTFVSGVALAYLMSFKKILLYLFLGLFTIEFIFFAHDYWVHYRYGSENVWSAGMKELIMDTEKHTDRTVVISPKGEHPLIFYLYYTRFDPKKFQELVKSNQVYNSTTGKQNLDGNRIGDTNLFIASLVDYKNRSSASISGAVYYLTRGEVETTGIRSVATIGDIISLPSGEPLYYEVHY